MGGKEEREREREKRREKLGVGGEDGGGCLVPCPECDGTSHDG